MTDNDRKAAVFSEHRRYLFAVADRLLGIAEDAEDVLQDGWLRFARADVDEVENPRAFLVTIVTRLSLDLLRSARRRREDYVGVWLPEPIETREAIPRDLVEEAESASFAFLLLLERLNPVERATLVLHDVFDFSHKEIATAIHRSTDATRQALSRARQRLGRTPKRAHPATDHGRTLVDRFMRATESGAMDDLVETFAADVVLMSDGGGRVNAANRPLAGRSVVGRFFRAIATMAPPDARVSATELNGQPAMLVHESGTLTNAFLFDATDEGITAIYVVRNPQKLHRLAGVR